MTLSPFMMRVILVVCLVGEALLAAVFLSRRRLSFYEYLGWGLLALLVPVMGPFLVIWSCPGKPINRHHAYKITRHLRHARDRFLDQLL